MTSSGRPTRTDWVVTVGTLLAMVTTASVRTSSFRVPEQALLAVTVLSWLPLLVRTYRPVTALAATATLEALHIALLGSMDLLPPGDPMGAYQPVPIATMVAAYTVAVRVRPRRAWFAAGGASALLLLTGLVFHGRTLLATDMVAVDLVLIAAGVGSLVRANHERARRAADRLAEQTRQAVLDERLRIARDLHDALAHNLTLVSAQASVAEYLLHADPDAAATALRGIAQHSREAILELRATVGLLRYDLGEVRDDGELRPVPSLSQLDELVGGFTGSGATLTVIGTPRPLEQHADLAAYRILQEALTNATKHGADGAIEVDLDWTGTQVVTLSVVNTVPTQHRAPLLPGTGHGLIGMRERAAAAGGSLDVRLLPDGRFQVRASLPAADAQTGRPATEEVRSP